MKCFFCKSEELINGTSSKLIEIGNNIIIIRNVPSLICELCGEKYYSDAVMARLETLVAHVQEAYQEVSILDYTKVA